MTEAEIEAAADDLLKAWAFPEDERHQLMNRIVALCLKVREADAKVCDDMDKLGGAADCAAAIRSQG